MFLCTGAGSLRNKTGEPECLVFNKNIDTIDALETQWRKDTVGKCNTKHLGKAEWALTGEEVWHCKNGLALNQINKLTVPTKKVDLPRVDAPAGDVRG